MKENFKKWRRITIVYNRVRTKVCSHWTNGRDTTNGHGTLLIKVSQKRTVESTVQ